MVQDKKIWVLQRIVRYKEYSEEERDIRDSFAVLATKKSSQYLMYRNEFSTMLEQKGLEVIRSRSVLVDNSYLIHLAQINLKPFFRYDSAQGGGFDELEFKRNLFPTQIDREENELYFINGIWVSTNYNLSYFFRDRRLFNEISSKNSQKIPLETILHFIETNGKYDIIVEEMLKTFGLKILKEL